MCINSHKVGYKNRERKNRISYQKNISSQTFFKNILKNVLSHCEEYFCKSFISYGNFYLVLLRSQILKIPPISIGKELILYVLEQYRRISGIKV